MNVERELVGIKGFIWWAGNWRGLGIKIKYNKHALYTYMKFSKKNSIKIILTKRK